MLLPACEEYQLQPRNGLSISVLDVNFLVVFLGVSVWFAVMNHKVSMLQVIFSSQLYIKQLAALALLPPVFASCLLSLLLYGLCWLIAAIFSACRERRATWELLRRLVPFFAIPVVLLEVFEAIAALELLRQAGRRKDVLTGCRA